MDTVAVYSNQHCTDIMTANTLNMDPEIARDEDEGKSILKIVNINGKEPDPKIGPRKYRKRGNCSPALHNDVILHCIFGYLNMEDIKECRLVCRRWSKLAEPQLRKQSAVSISANKKTILRFQSTFVNSETKMPFGSVILRSNDGKAASATFSLLMLENFFTDWKNQIRTLELYNIDVYTLKKYLYTQHRSLRREYTLNPLLQCNLTSLTVDCLRSTKISISVDNLRSIKFINLSHGAMLAMSTTGLKITAAEVELRDIHFLQNGKILKTVVINNFVDFNRAKKISLIQQNGAAKLSLDMAKNITVDILHLDTVEILGDKDAKWNIKQMMSLRGIPWTTRNQIKFTNLDFKESTLDIAALPQTIECLRVDFLPRNTVEVISSSPVILHNLQYLSLRTNSENEDVLSLFKNCPKLSDVAYRCLWNDGVNVEWLAPTIRRLEITDIGLSLAGDALVDLETLILQDWQSEDWKMVVNYFNYQKLVICSSNYESRFSNFASIWFLNNLKTTIQRLFNWNERAAIYVGPVALFKNSPFLQCVNMSTIDVSKTTDDTPLLYWFRFTSVLGDAIEESEFNQVRNLVNSDRFENDVEGEDVLIIQ